MKKYLTKKEKIINFFNFSFNKKIITIFKLIGIRDIIYYFIYYLLFPLFKNKSNFIKGLLFDLQKTRHEFVGISNKKEKFILYSRDQIISKEIYVKGEFDLHKLKKAIKILNENDYNIERLFDVGANIGVVCIPAVKQQVVKKSFAIEAEKNNFKLLKTNIILNDLEKDILTYNYALSDSDDKVITMELSKTDSGDHRVRDLVNFNIHDEDKRELVKVKTKKFDTLFNGLDGKKDLIWIDAQAHEPFILEGSKNAIEKKVPIVIEFWPYGLKRNKSWEKMISIIKEFKYYVDLSSDENKLEITNNEGLGKLLSEWEQEKKNKHSLFTDILLLK